MAERHREGDVPDKREEAANLAREAMEEQKHGNKEEAEFLAEEARELDPKAAEAVLHEQDRQRGGKSRSGGESKSGKAAGERGSASRGKSGETSRSKSGETGERRSTGSGKRGGSAERTIDHEVIRAWVEGRNGRPSVVKRSHDTEQGGGILRIDFNEPEESLEEVPWDEFFEVFEDRKLAFLHQDRTADGKVSRFFKFVHREEEDEEEQEEEADER